MTILSTFYYRSFDSTLWFNKHSTVLPKGLYELPNITAGTGLSVLVDPPWMLKSLEGLTVQEETDGHQIDMTSLSSPFGDFYLCMLAKYVIKAEPVIGFVWVTVADYDAAAHVDHDYLVRFARVTVPNGTTQITNDMISVSDGNHDIPQSDVIPFVDPDAANQVYSQIRTIINIADIPHGDGRENELIYVMEDSSFYLFNSNTSQFERRSHAMRNGSANFGGVNGSGDPIAVPISIGTAVAEYVVVISPTADHGGNLGDYHVIKTPTSFSVFNTGNAVTSFDWAIFF